jgi:hypothetical protein
MEQVSMEGLCKSPVGLCESPSLGNRQCSPWDAPDCLMSTVLGAVTEKTENGGWRTATAPVKGKCRAFLGDQMTVTAGGELP